MHNEVKGLVLRTTDINESDRMVTIYTEEMGLISAMAKGARSLKSRKMSSTMQFCFSSFVLYTQGERCWIKEASLIESFFELRESIEGLALAGYIVEVLNNVATAEADKDLLRLCLNSLYAIAKKKAPLAIVKGAFEIRVASMLGFMPDVLSCTSCGEKTGDFFFDIMAGAIECRECHAKSSDERETLSFDHESHILCLLTEGAKTALCYSIYAPLEKLFSFNIGGDDLRFFSRSCEEYLLNHLERSFKTLDFYNEVKR